MNRYLLFLLLAMGTQSAYSLEMPSEPILRIETGMHTALIRRIAVDNTNNRLVTCSDDKTIRIWQLPENRLLSTLRVPIGEAHEGKLFALAISPDGKFIAAGGWTGWDWEGSASIYFFNTETGELTQRLSGFRDAINTLAWSPKGDHLVVGLQGKAGLDIIRISDKKTIYSDKEYMDKVTDVDFSSSGRLVTISLDGMARLYNRDFKLIGRKKIAGGSSPVSVEFSPDSKRFAVGFNDKPAVAVSSAKDMKPIFSADTSNMDKQFNLSSVSWSSDGNYLYAGGDYRGEGINPIYRWSNGGSGARESIPLSNLRITEIQQMPNGHMAFSTEDPGFGIIDKDSNISSYKASEVIDHSNSHGQLLLSHDGITISYPFNRDRNNTHTFSIYRGGDQLLTETTNSEQLPPRLSSDNFTLSNWRNSYNPTINGKTPVLMDYEMSRTYAISRDDKSLLLGTEWALRLLDKDINEIWNIQLPAVAWAVNLSNNGRLAVAALSDGTIRWYRTSDGSELLSYFPLADGKEWISWIPSGYYISSVYGDNYIGWHVNRGKELNSDFYKAVQFDRILYRPDVIKWRLKEYLSDANVRNDNSDIDTSFDISNLSEIAPPRIKLDIVDASIHDSRSQLNLTFSAEMNSLNMLDYVVYLNDIPLTSTQDRILHGSDTEFFTRQASIPLTQNNNNVRVEVFNGVSMGVAEKFIHTSGDIFETQKKGDLYLLAIGINHFPNLPDEVNLAYAANDAMKFERLLVSPMNDNYRNIYSKVISDSTKIKPIGDEITDSLQFIHQATPNDTVIIFLASHGISDKAGNYYFVPRDAVPEDLDKLSDGGEIESLIPWTKFFDALRITAGKRLLIVDTCQASNIKGRFESHSLMKRSASSLFSLMLASKGNEESQEHAKAKHGLFTYSILQSLTPDSDSNGDGAISINELFSFSLPIVEIYRNKRIGPQTPQLISPLKLGESTLFSFSD